MKKCKDALLKDAPPGALEKSLEVTPMSLTAKAVLALLPIITIFIIMLVVR